MSIRRASSSGSQVARSVHYNEQEAMLLVSVDAVCRAAGAGAELRLELPVGQALAEAGGPANAELV